VIANEIANGWFNTFFPNEDIEEVAKDRIKICLTHDGLEPHCRFYNENGLLGPKCNNCGCPLKAKIRSKNSRCPKGKWKN